MKAAMRTLGKKSKAVSSFVSSSSASTNGQVSSLSVNAPASIASGNELVAVFYWVGSNTVTITPPSGWTQAGQGGGNSNFTTVFTKTATGSEPGSYSFTSSGGIFWTAIIEQWTNAPNAVDGSVGFNQANTTTSGSAPSVTASGTNELWIVSVGDDNQTIAPSTPSGMTARTNVKNATSGLGLWLYDKSLTSSGATGSASFTFSSAVDYASSSFLLH